MQSKASIEEVEQGSCDYVPSAKRLFEGTTFRLSAIRCDVVVWDWIR